MDIEEVKIKLPEGANIILGYSHFIKTVEDLNEIVRTSMPNFRYSVVFSEASGDRLIRYEGNDKELVDAGIDTIKRISAGHTFAIYLRDAYPINILNAVKQCQEVGTIYAATANPLSVVVYKGADGNAVLGVIDGQSPKGTETEEDKNKRKSFLRMIGYKS
ncbi:MAG: adenosine-specific kinase [Thermoplasmata archaeon]